MGCGCLDVCNCEINDTNSISWTGNGTSGSPYAGSVIPDPNACNLLSVGPNGVLSSLVTADSATVDFSGCGTAGSPLTADASVIIPPFEVDNAFRPIWKAGGWMLSGQTADDYPLGADNQLDGSNHYQGMPYYYIPSSYAIAGKTIQWRLLIYIETNSQGTGSVNFTGHIVPLTVGTVPIGFSGGPNNLTYTFGAPFLSTAVLTPGTAGFSAGVSSIVNEGPNALYMLIVTTDGTIDGVGRLLRIDMILEMRYV